MWLGLGASGCTTIVMTMTVVILMMFQEEVRKFALMFKKKILKKPEDFSEASD